MGWRAAAIVGAVLVLGSTRSAQAQEEIIGLNYLVGPVFGVRVGMDENPHVLVGVEGGIGWGPERVNLGIERRPSSHGVWETFAYFVLEPWLVVGASLGIGVDLRTQEAHAVLGVWEGYGRLLANCHDWGAVLSVAVGYRFTGVPELYVTPKVGLGQGRCFVGD